VIAGLADRLAVMYGGYIIESSGVRELYAHPTHPYTIGLLGSLPRMDESGHRRLTSIEGLPPVLLEKPSYCPFAPRCRFAVEHCWNENPPLMQVAPDHLVACWVDPETGRER
jgi:oligopeptide transport system ATP-binding protein